MPVDPTNKYVNAARDADEALIARLKRERDAAYEALVRLKRERNAAYEALANNEREFKTLRNEYAKNIEAFERVSKQIDVHSEKNNDVTRALEKANVIVEAMLTHHKPVVLAEDATDPDGVAYGHYIGVGSLRYGDLEVAAGALDAAILQVSR